MKRYTKIKKSSLYEILDDVEIKQNPPQLIHENLRYLLWKNQIKRKDWTACITRWTGCDIQRAEALLEGATLDFSELEQIAIVVKLSQDTLLDTRLIDKDKINVLAINLRYILNRMEHGARKKLADKLKVHPTTISRWCNEDYPPPSDRNLRLLSEHLCLPDSVSLTNDPLFLSDEPLSEMELRKVLWDLIDKADIILLREMYKKLMIDAQDVYTPTQMLIHFLSEQLRGIISSSIIPDDTSAS